MSTQECAAEFIDGTWETAGCGCEQCHDYRSDQIESDYEAGDITYDEAESMHRLNGSWSDDEE